MAVRYSADYLLHLRESPLCTKPTSLPPLEDWMGPPPELATAARAQNKPNTDRRHQDSMGSFDGTNRRPGVDRHASRNSANPEDIVLGPPKTSFASSGSFRNGNGRSAEQDKDAKDSEARDRLSYRGRNGESDGWSTVKPRKSFGNEGAERFQGRMGGERAANERRPRERDDRDATKERTQRTFDREAEEVDGRPRNGLSRGKSEPWFKNEAESKPSLSNRERIDRAKSWRDRENKDAETFESNNDRTPGRSYDRRWDRDQRAERAPEWAMEEPSHKAGGHTEEDFKKFMESMKAKKSSAAASAKQPVDLAQLESSIQAEQPAVASAPAMESGPDKFFMAFAGNTGLNVSSPRVEVDKEPVPQPGKPGGGKSSRFTSFFSPAPQDESVHSKPFATESTNPLAALVGGGGSMGATGGASGSDNEKQAFQVLLQKLQRSGVQGSTPPAAQLFQQPSQAPPQDSSPAGQVRSPSGYPQFAPPEQRSDSRTHQQLHEIHAPRPVMPVHPSSHQDKLLQDLVERQRQQASSQGPGRPEVNRNTEFLMNLMKSQPEPIRTEQMLVRMHQQRNPSMSHMPEREPDFAPQGGRSSQPPMRGQPPPGFMEEQFHRGEPDGRQQPTQILQRPPPPGLDQMGPGWMAQGGGPIPPQQQRNMGPPPGLAGGPGGPGGPARNHPGMPGMFAPGPGPNFPPGAGFPPPENMSGPPPRGMPPPGFFGGPPPPGFMGPPGMAGPGFGGPGPVPDGPGFPFDGRGMPPPPGAAQAFRRQ